MVNRATWNDLVLVVRGISSRTDGPPVRGSFTISSDEALRALMACLYSEPDTHLQFLNDEDPTVLKVGQTVEIEVAPRFGFGLLVPNVKALLEAQGARIAEPANFLILDELLSKTDNVTEDHLLTRYRLVLSFIQTLKQSAAFLDSDQPSLIFIKDGKFEMPTEYTDEDLRKLPIDAVRDLTSILPKGTHEEQCKCIMAEAVINMTKHLPIYKRFQYLLEHAADLKKRYEQGYNLFASGFSYEKVRDQVESARLEYVGKIHKVFSDIQNQLLGIPVATIIVASQMKDAKAIGYEFWVNSSVLIGCWVFAVLMIFLLQNQSHTLGVIDIEIKRQKRQLEKDYASVATLFFDTFTYLTRRAETQKYILWAIDAFVVVGLLLSHIVFFKLTVPARDWIIRLLPSLNKIL